MTNISQSMHNIKSYKINWQGAKARRVLNVWCTNLGNHFSCITFWASYHRYSTYKHRHMSKLAFQVFQMKSFLKFFRMATRVYQLLLIQKLSRQSWNAFMRRNGFDKSHLPYPFVSNDYLVSSCNFLFIALCSASFLSKVKFCFKIEIRRCILMDLHGPCITEIR